MGVNLEIFFESPEKAALDFALFYNDNSIRDNKEFASSIYAVQNDNGDRGYTYTLPNVGQENHCIPSLPTLGSFWSQLFIRMEAQHHLMGRFMQIMSFRVVR